jgi:hypothetical protein
MSEAFAIHLAGVLAGTWIFGRPLPRAVASALMVILLGVGVVDDFSWWKLAILAYAVVVSVSTAKEWYTLRVRTVSAQVIVRHPRSLPFDYEQHRESFGALSWWRKLHPRWAVTQ